jgi:Mg-chelatase subunit ChlD
VGVMRAQDGLSVLLDPTSDHAAIAKAVEEMPVSGKAALLDTVEQAAKLADAVLTKSAVRVAVLYITDSDVRNYREDFTNPVINSSDSRDLSRRFPEGLIREKILKVENNLAAREAPIFIVHLSYRTDRLNEAYQRGLMQIAESTGGASAFCRSEAEIPAAITRTIEAAQSVYIVDVKAPQRLPRSAPVTIESGSGTVQHPPRIVLEK